ncbi:olfactory receptor 154-like [Tachyglossus aculeatus]|uniref:olfactory receptor 154-like n=1 Tax=Tachyglossus aculeatus TaxID=9261 RepID=UPI0018F3CE0F|nr:olfactory receptor 154-like [Tachyglossus aculeatus]
MGKLKGRSTKFPPQPRDQFNRLIIYIREMDQDNIAAVPEFILMGLTDLPEFQLLLFLVFLAVFCEPLLPRCYADLFLEVRTICLIECAIQMYLFVACVTTEGYFLAVKAHDCFMAIGNPMLYMVVLSLRVCTQRMLGSYLTGFLEGLSNTFPSEVLLFSMGIFSGTVTSLKIVMSYVYILITTLKICSAAGRCKAFSTCASHLTVVGLLYETTISIYVWPSSQYAPENGKVVSMFYTPVISVLNPLIYSLRKKDENDAL